jgi:uroporphyrinogen decarboxylase
MTRRERVWKALQHQQTDFIPYQVDFTQQEHDRVADFLHDPGFEPKIMGHIERASFSGPVGPETDRPGFFRDDYGVVWNKTGVDKDIGMMDTLLLKEPDVHTFDFPVLDEKLAHERFRALIANGQDTFKIGRLSMALFERAWSLRGMENLLCDMLLNPSFVDDLLDRIVEYDLKIIDIGLSYDEIDGFYFGDDWGQQTPGLIMGRKNWRRFLKPRLQVMYGRIKAKNRFVIQHSCGNILELYPDLIEIGLDVHNTFQPEIYDIGKVKSEFGQDLSFWGGISTQRLLPFGTPEAVRDETIRIMRIVGKGGGYVAAPTHYLPGDVPAENVLAMVDVFRNQDRYLRQGET